MKSNSYTNASYVIAEMYGMQPIHPQFVVQILSYISELNLRENMIANAQISIVAWDRMDYSKRKRFIDSLLKIKQIPEVKENFSLHIGINLVLKDVISIVEPKIICNAAAGQFILDKYGLKGEVTTTM